MIAGESPAQAPRRQDLLDLFVGAHTPITGLMGRSRVGVLPDMKPLAITVPETASVAQAAVLMTREGVDHLSVVDADRRVVGILTALDVMRWLARPSGVQPPMRRPPRPSQDTPASLRALDAMLDAERSHEESWTSTARRRPSWAQRMNRDPPLRAVPECPACQRIVADVCGANVVERSWFRVTSRRGPCAMHREGAGTA